MIGEPLWKKKEREERMKARFPELQYGEPEDIMRVDNQRLTTGGGAVSSLSQSMMKLAAHAAEEARKKREAEMRALDQPTENPGYQPIQPMGPTPGVPRGVAEAFPETIQGGRVYDSGASDPLGYIGGQISENLDRPVSGLAGAFAAQEGGPGPAADWFKFDKDRVQQSWMNVAQGFMNPDEMGFGQAAALQPLPEGARGPVGGLLDMALDPTNLIPLAPAADVPRISRGAAKTAARGATAYRDLTRGIPVGASIKDVSGGLPEDLAGGGAPSFQDAIEGLRSAVRTEASLRNKGIAQSEIRAGRAAQFGSVRRSLDQAMESGLTGEELARQARAGASVGGLRRTIAEPVMLSQAQRDALFDEVMTRVADPKQDAGLYLTTTRALQKALDGEGLQPHEIRALQPLLGHDMATALAGRAPKDPPSIPVPRIGRKGGGGKGLPGQQPSPPESGTPLPGATRGRKSQDPLYDPRAEEHMVSAIKQGLKFDAKEHLKRVGPPEEALMERARKLLYTEKRKLDLPGEPTVDAMKPEVEAAIEHWLAGNRDILDNMGIEGSQLLANINAQLTGNVADSYLTAALHRKNILAEALRETWGDVADEAAAINRDKIINRAVEALFQRELKIRYPQGVPERITELMKTTRPTPYNESLGAISTFNQRAKNSMFGVLDIGVFGVQGVNAIRRGGIPMFASMINRSLAALHMPNVATSYADSMLPKQIQYGIDGVKQGSATGVFQRRQGSQEIGSLFQYLGPIGRAVDKPYMAVADKMSQWQFGTVMGAIRNATYEGDLVMLHMLGRDITNAKVRKEAAANANAIGSFAETALRKSRAQKEGVLSLSAPMLRARVQQITQMAKLITPQASPTERILAASTIASTVGFTLMAGKYINDQIGVGDFEFMPGKPGFGKVTTASGLIIDIIPQDSVENAFAKSIRAILEEDPGMAVEAWGNFAIGSAGPAPQIVAGALGVGYEAGRGYRYGDLGEGQGLKGRVLNLAPIPPIIEHLSNEGFDPLATPLEEAGVSTFQETPFAEAARVYKDETGGDWRTATARQQSDFKEKHPDIAEALVQEQVDRPGPKGDLAEMRRDFQEVQEREDAQVLVDRDWDTWKDNLASRTNQLIGAASIAYGDEPIENPKDAFERWLNEGKLIRGDDGVMSREEWDQLDQWVAAQNPTDQQLIADETGHGGTKLQKERRAVADRLDDAGYFDIRDKVWTRVTERVAGMEQYATADDFMNEVSQRVRDRLQQRGIDPNSATAEIVIGEVLGTLGPLEVWRDVSNTVEEAWIETNADLAKEALQYGYIDAGSLRNREAGLIMASERQ